MTMSEMKDTEEAVRAVLNAALSTHGDALTRAFHEQYAYLGDDAADIGGVLCRTSEGLRVFVGDAARLAQFAARLAEEKLDPNGALPVAAAEMLMLLSVPCADDQERVLVVDLPSGAVARTRIPCDARRQYRAARTSEVDDWARELVAQWHAPPGAPKTANNLELIAMNAAHVIGAIIDRFPAPLPSESFAELSRALELTRPGDLRQLKSSELRRRADERRRLADLIERVVGFTDFADAVSSDAVEKFLILWRASAYAKLEINHKLAAALSLTDTDGMDIVSPWEACSIVVPDGLGFDTLGPDGSIETVARIWCVGADAISFIGASGKVCVPTGDRLASALRSLARGAFIALANPAEFKKQRTSDGSRSVRKSRRGGLPDFSHDRYLLSAPVTVDMRELLAEHLAGRRKGGGASPKVQFLVRGHWRQQAHGPARALRKTIWVQPFWKGPEETRVLLRSHVLKDQPKREVQP
jgi:hypothetical protein